MGWENIPAAAAAAYGLYKSTKSDDSEDPMQRTFRAQMDPGTEARQLGLWNQAQQLAGTQPFSSQYGGVSQLGLSRMSQQGQQYLSDQILGSGQYGARDLGYQGYARKGPDRVGPSDPGWEAFLAGEEARSPAWQNEAGEWQLGRGDALRQEGITNPGWMWDVPGTGAAKGPTWAYQPDIRSQAEWNPERDVAGPPLGLGSATPYPAVPETGLPALGFDPATGTNPIYVDQGRPSAPQVSNDLRHGAKAQPSWRTVDGAGVYKPSPAPGGLLGTRAQEESGRAPGPTRVGPNDPGWEAFLAAEDARSPGRGAGLRADAAGHPGWTWELPAEQQVPGRPYSQGVGIREMEEAGDVTRRMLRETDPGTPGYDRFLAGELDPVTGSRGPRGWQAQGQAGIGETPGFERDATGNLVPIKGFGFTGAELEGPKYDTEGKLVPGYRPGYDAIRGGVTGVGDAATRATPFGVAGQDPFTVEETRVGPNDPAAWEAFLVTKDPANRAALEAEAAANPDWTWPVASDVPTVDRGLISGQTGYGVQGTGQRIARDAAGEPLKNPDGSVMMEPVPLAMTEAQRALSQIGRTARPEEAIDELTGDRISAASLENIGFGEGATDLTGIAGQAGYGTEGIRQRAVRDESGGQAFDPVTGEPIMESALGLSAQERALSQIGQADRPGRVLDPFTGEYTTAAVAERIGATDISPIGQFRDPVTGELTNVMTPSTVTPKTVTAGSASATTQERLDTLGVVGVDGISKPSTVTVGPFTGQTTTDVAAVAPTAITGPGGLTVDPVTGQTTTAVAGVTPGEFGGSSFLGGPAIADYMNTAGTEAAVTQARQDYEVALNREKARQAQVGAFGSRGTVEEAGLIEAQERNIAQIRGAGFDRAAQMMESDAARRQQAGLQGQQLGFQGGMAGQALEAQRRESDAARAQQAEMQGQQLGFQGQLQTQQLLQTGNIRGAELGLQASMQGQQLEARRRESDAARAQQAEMAGQQLQTQIDLQGQQLGQASATRESELGVQAGLASQQIEAQRLESNAARVQQAALAGQQLGTQAQMQTQQLGFQGGMQAQQLGQQTAIRQAELGMEAARANQQTALSSGSQAQQIGAAREMRQAELNLQRQQQTQQLEVQAGMQQAGFGQQTAMGQAQLEMEGARANQSTALASGSQAQQLESARRMRQAELNLQRQQQTQQLGLQAGMQQAGFGQQAAVRQTELDLQREQGTQGLGAEAFMQQRQLGQQAAMASASNALAAAQSDQQAALASGNQAAALEAQRRAQGAQAQIDIARQTQALGADAAGQQAQQEAARRQALSQMGLEAGGMGLDAQAQFRQQQMAAAQQLADVGGMRQGATFGAAGQLAGMGAQQEQARQAQMAWDYQQWLRGQEGGAESLALVQSMMPGGQQWQYGRKPSTAGQIGGGLLSAAAIGADIYKTSRPR